MRITILHDVFRSQVFGCGGVNRVSAWWDKAVGPKLRALGHTVERPAAFAGDRPRVLLDLVRLRSWPRDPSTWARLFSDPELLPEVEELLAPLVETDLILGWTLPPNMLVVLHRMGLRVLDIGLDPLRFCADLFLRVRTSDPALASRLADMGVARDVPAEAARAVRPDAVRRPNFVLFAGQVAVDASLIVGAQIATAAPLAERIAASVPAGHTLLLRPHPHAGSNADLLALGRAIPDSRLTNDPIYALLAAPELRKVLTLSSSVAEEAPYFGKPAFRLVRPDADRLPTPWLSRFHRIGPEAQTAAFWDRLLSGGGGLPAEAPDRALRTVFVEQWGRTDARVRRDRAVSPGETIRVGAGERGGDLLGAGWSHAEDWGVWTEAETATLLVQPVEAEGPMRLVLNVIARVTPDGPPLSLTILAPLEPVMRYEVAVMEPAPLMFEMTCAAGMPETEITLRLDNLAPPPPGDGRQLGVGLRSIGLQPC